MTLQHVSGVFSTVFKDTDSFFMRVFLHAAILFGKEENLSRMTDSFLTQRQIQCCLSKTSYTASPGNIDLLQDSDLLALDKVF